MLSYNLLPLLRTDSHTHTHAYIYTHTHALTLIHSSLQQMLSGSNRRILTADLHTGFAMCGIQADARQLVNQSRTEARNYKSFYGNSIPGKVLAERVASHVHMHTLYWCVRTCMRDMCVDGVF